MRREALIDWAFWLWALVGAGLAFGMLSFAGFFVGLGSIVLLVVFARTTRTRGAWRGLVVGVGGFCLFVAYLAQREEETAHGGPDPLPWLVAGLVLVVVGVAAELSLARSRAR